MIIHNSQPRHAIVLPIRVVNSRLPVYQITYGDGLGDVVEGLFRRMGPKALPIAKQLSMKDIDVVKDKALGTVGNLAGKAFTAIKDRLAQLIRRPKAVKQPPVKLLSTELMPADVSKVINQAATQKLASLINQEVTQVPEQINSSLISGSGLRFRRR